MNRSGLGSRPGDVERAGFTLPLCGYQVQRVLQDWFPGKLVSATGALVAWTFMLLVSPQSAAAEPVRVAVFPFEINIERQMGMGYGDFSGTAEEQERLGKATEKLRSLLSESEAYEIIPLESIAEDIEKAQPLFKCNGCDGDLAKKVSATQAITGTVQKSSDTLLNVSIFIRDVASGEIVNSMAVSIRQNTDAGWLRGVRWLVRNRLLKG